MNYLLQAAFAIGAVACTDSSFVRRPSGSPLLGDDAGDVTLSDRISELEQQVEDLKSDLNTCTAAVGERHTASSHNISHHNSTHIREYRSLGWNNVKTDLPSNERRLEDHQPVIGVCLASTSKSMQADSGSGLTGIPLFTVLLPSLAKNMEPGFHYKIYVGVDAGDSFYDNELNEQDVMEWFADSIEPVAHKVGATASMKILIFENENHKPGPAFNHACKTAYDEGADYMYRVNDDSEFMTPFAKKFVAELHNRCPPNIGVTGPTCHEGNTHILTHDFTHRHHMEIFKEYYPTELTDWWLDDWVTHVYGVHHTSRVLDVIVKHQMGAAGTRYKVNHAAKKELSHLQEEGNSAIRAYVESNFANVSCDAPVGPVSNVLIVSAHSEYVSDIDGIRGLVLDHIASAAGLETLVANEYECSYRCYSNSACAAFTWSPNENPTVLTSLKSILGIASNNAAESAGSCFVFDELQAARVRSVSYKRGAVSGAKDSKSHALLDRIRSLLRPVDPHDVDHFASSVIRVSFGGGTIEGWQIDSGAFHRVGNGMQVSSWPTGTFGWNCDMRKDVRHRETPEFTALLNNIQLMSPHGKCKNPRWAIKVRNGIYRVVAGFADTADQVFVDKCKLNGESTASVSVVGGTSFEYQSFQEVDDGVISFEGLYREGCSSIAYIIIDDATHYFDA